jgi:hypothetical protein
MFLGYSSHHKGYKCLNPSSGCVYISRDGVFDETVFSFAELHPNAGNLLQPEILFLPPTLRNSCGSMNLDAAKVSNIANSDLPVCAAADVTDSNRAGVLEQLQIYLVPMQALIPSRMQSLMLMHVGPQPLILMTVLALQCMLF